MSNNRLVIIGLAVVLAFSIVGATAFTTGVLERDASVNVTSDANGLLSLQASDDTNAVYENSSGALEIDMQQLGSADGVNVASKFTFGDTADAQNKYAFNVSSNNASPVSLTVSYNNVTNDEASSTDNIKFAFYNSDGTDFTGADTTQVNVTETTDQTFELSSTETLHVVMIVDTNGLTDASDLSGDLKFELSQP